MAITTNSLEVTKADFSTVASRWRVNASSADASGGEEIKAAPGSGYELLITRLRIVIGAAITVTIGEGEEGTAVRHTLLGPLGGAAMAVPFDWSNDPLVLAPNKSLSIDASGAGVVCVYVEGMTRVTEIAGVASHTPSASVSASPSSSASA